jgi:hydroxyacylglutathione hydrolase
MQIIPIPVLSDNFSYLLLDSGRALVIDPGAAAPVLAALQQAGAKLEGILLTHHHRDHTGGCAGLRAQTRCAIAGPAECAACGLDRTVGEGDAVTLGTVTCRVLATPGHTRGHVAYVCDAAPAVWTGDTLFAGGCGRILEGTAAEMWRSLLRLRELPPGTRVHSGHDYTCDNLEFAAGILPHDAAIAARWTEVRAGPASGSSSVAVERATNIFLRADTEPVRVALDLRGADPVTVFAELRRRKDAW